jgi:hypothetical protein
MMARNTQKFTHGATVAGLGRVQWCRQTRSCPTPDICHDDKFVVMKMNVPSRKIVQYKLFFRRSISSTRSKTLTSIL